MWTTALVSLSPYDVSGYTYVYSFQFFIWHTVRTLFGAYLNWSSLMYDSIARYFQINIYCGGDGVPPYTRDEFLYRSEICNLHGRWVCLVWWEKQEDAIFIFQTLWLTLTWCVCLSVCWWIVKYQQGKRVIHPQAHVNTANVDSINEINMNRKVCGRNL